MPVRFRAPLLLLAAVLAVASTAMAQDHSSPTGPTRERPARAEQTGDSVGVLRLLPADAVSEKQATIDGERMTYSATAGTLSIFDQKGERSAAVFYTAYVKKAVDTNRPVTFVLNGGPGAASVFLHLGLVGPRIIDFGPDGRDGAAARLRDNPDSWLGFTDLVIIDPIGTGWSRPAKSDGGGAFWGVERDADVLAKVIALYVARNSRSSSPKYILGESYGGFRAAKVARALQNDQGIVVSGIAMVSPLLETSFLWGGTDNAFGAALQFPSLAATELERTGRFTPQALAEAEHFALGDYLTTLAGPPPLSDKANAFYGRIAQITGVPPEVVAKSRGYVRGAFLDHLRANGQTVSIYDATFATPDAFPDSSRRQGNDPILDGFIRALSGTFVGYARDELGFKTDITYILLNDEVTRKWDWGNRRNPPGASDDLRQLLALNPSFRLLVSHGRSDLVTPYGVSRYILDRLPVIGGPGRVALKLYPGGHMFYFDADTRRSFTADVKAFYQSGR